MEKDFLRNLGAVILGIAALLMIPAVAYGVYRYVKGNDNA